jgi:hypothetical protein
MCPMAENVCAGRPWRDAEPHRESLNIHIPLAGSYLIEKKGKFIFPAGAMSDQDSGNP